MAFSCMRVTVDSGDGAQFRVDCDLCMLFALGLGDNGWNS